MKESTALRIGAVNYLNTKPLVFTLAQRAPQAKIVYDLPSRRRAIVRPARRGPDSLD
jgi:hypothetical protein